MRVLNRNVTVHKDGQSFSFGPGACPDWAADLIEFPGVWAGEGSDSGETPELSPMSDAAQEALTPYTSEEQAAIDAVAQSLSGTNESNSDSDDDSEEDDEGVDVIVERPAKNASRDDWAEYLDLLGVEYDETHKRDDLIALAEKFEAASEGSDG